MANPRDELSLVIDSGSDYYSSCGYCDGKSCSLSHGMHARILTVYAYQDLIDQGWRRSGRYLYKPNLARTCCKAHTIRLDVAQFSPDKGQRRLLRKWRDFLTVNGGAAQDAATGQDPSAVQVATSDADARMSDMQLEPGMPLAAAGGHESPRGKRGHPDPSAAATAREGQPGSHFHPQQQQQQQEPPQAGGAGTLGAGRVRRRTDSGDGGSDAHVAGTIAAQAPKEDEETRLLLQQLLAAALAAAVSAGDLPCGDYAAPTVQHCTAKQRQTLPADVRCTSASAFPLAAAATRVRAAGASVAGPPGRGTACEAGPSSETADPPRGPDAASCPSSRGKQGPGTGSKKQQRKHQAATGQLARAVRPDDVAQSLARHFNALVESAGSGSSSSGGSAVEAAAFVQPAAHHAPGEPSVMQLDGGALEGSLVRAMASLLGHRRPEALAAKGHINFRIPAGEVPQGGAGAAARAQQGGMLAADSGSGQQPGRDLPAESGSGTGHVSQPSAAAGVDIAGRMPQEGGLGRAATGLRQAAARGAVEGAGDPLAVPSGRLEIRLVPSQFLEEEFELYSRYQVAQHGDKPEELSRTSYTRFLVESPLRPVGRDRDPAAPECGYGSFHQQYWLDGKLIAVGVVDVLPRCLSSVYFFWDTQLAPLALGKFSALQEIRWVQQQRASSPGLHYYYMGFYIHTCPKMRYKAEYRPSDLLCPVRKVWVRVTPSLLAAIEQQPFRRLSAVEGAACQPNLAAPPRGAPDSTADEDEDEDEDESEEEEEEEAGEQRRHAGAGGAQGSAAGGRDDVGGTLIYMSKGAKRPVPWEVVRRLKLFPKNVETRIEQAIRSWRKVVGWAAPSLVYEL